MKAVFHNVEQNTEEWLALRAGRLTGSAFSKIMANYGKTFGDPAKKLAIQIALEQIAGGPLANESYSNAHMERGHDQEPIARQLYCEQYFTDISNGGFFEYGDFVGCSPDGITGDSGLIENNGIIEIKSVIGAVHYANIKRQSYDPPYKWQLIGNLHYTGSGYIDFVSYCADFPESRRLYVCRVRRDSVSTEISQLEDRVAQFRQLVDDSKQLILNGNLEVNL